MVGKISNFPFGGRMTTVFSPTFESWVSTAKEGILKPLSTMILEALEGPSGPYRRPCAKIIYSPSLTSADRLKMHELIVRVMDENGAAGVAFDDIVVQICDDFRSRGVAAEAIHLVANPPDRTKIEDVEVVEPAIVPCVSCGAINRLRKSAKKGIYRCGSCRTPIADPFEKEEVNQGEETLSLAGFLASLVLQPIVKKDCPPDDYVLFSDYMPRAALLFEVGCVLGYIFREHLPVFMQLFTAPGTEANLISILHRHAAERLNNAHENPSHFADVYFAQEATRLIGIMRAAGITDACDWLDMHKIAAHKIRVADIFTQLQTAPSQGVGFGSRFPELTADLLSSEIDSAGYREFHAFGLDAPREPPKRMTMQQWQEMAFSMIRPYVGQARPDLIRPLGL